MAMIRRRSFIVASFFTGLVCSLAMPGWVAASDVVWKEYVNGRFGFKIPYPASLVPQREPDNGGGRRFVSKDGKVELVAHAHYIGLNEGDSFHDRWNEALKEYGKSVTYKRKAATWFVISGVLPDGTEYYEKLHVQKHNYAAFKITYPHAATAVYSPWVEKIAKEFVPFLPDPEYDRAD